MKNRLSVSIKVLCVLTLFSISLSCIRIVQQPGGTTKDTTTVSFTQKVSPSKESQQFSAQGVVDVTVPGGVLKKETTLSVNSVKDTAGPVFTAPYKALSTYEISLGDLHQFASSLIIKAKYDPARLTGSQNPENSLTAAYYDESLQSWMVLPSMVDAENKQLIVLTNHLSKIQVGQWTSADKGSGLPGLRGPVQPIFRSVSLSMTYGEETVVPPPEDFTGDWGYPAGNFNSLTAEARTSNIPTGAYYVWRLNGKIVQEGLNKFTFQTELKQPGTVYRVHVQVSLDKQLPVVAETFREIKTLNSENKACRATIDQGDSCGFAYDAMYHRYGFPGKQYCFTAVVHNCPDNTPVSWSFGDGSSSDDKSVTHTWKTAGTKEIVLSRDNYKADSISVDIIDQPSVVLTCEPSTTIDLGDSCNFVASLTGVTDSNRYFLQDVAFVFFIEDEHYVRKSSGKPYGTRQAAIDYTFKNTGKYNIKVMATALTSAWLGAEAQIQVTVVNSDKTRVKIVPADGVDVGFTGETYTFLARSDNLPPNARYEWFITDDEFGNGKKYTGQSVSRSWSTPGKKQITLQVTAGESISVIAKDSMPYFVDEKPPPLQINKQPPPSQNQGSGWYLDGAPVITKSPLPAATCGYFGFSFNISSGSATGSESWKDCSGQSKCGGTYTGTVTWTPPPAFMKPGTQIPFTGSSKTTAQNSCGSLGIGSWFALKINGAIIIDVNDPKATQTSSYTVSTGSPGQKITIEAIVQAANKNGRVTYNYVYK